MGEPERNLQAQVLRVVQKDALNDGLMLWGILQGVNINLDGSN